jgi:hypothetical protein
MQLPVHWHKISHRHYSREVHRRDRSSTSGRLGWYYIYVGRGELQPDFLPHFLITCIYDDGCQISYPITPRSVPHTVPVQSAEDGSTSPHPNSPSGNRRERGDHSDLRLCPMSLQAPPSSECGCRGAKKQRNHEHHDEFVAVASRAMTSDRPERSAGLSTSGLTCGA